MADPAAQFTGFTVEAGAFLDELARNNTREWFSAHRADYDQLLRGPMTALLAEAQRQYGPGRVMRPNRDVRFSHDKSPYRTDISLWAGDLGGVYAHLDATGLDVGGGLYGPTREQLDRARSTIAERPDQADRLRQVIADLEQQGFQAPEPPLTTAPRGYPRNHPAIDLLRLTHYAERLRLPLTADPQLVYESWENTEPLLQWISDHLASTN